MMSRTSRARIFSLLSFALCPVVALAEPPKQPPPPIAVALRADDGFRLFADYYPPPESEHPAPFAILLHNHRSDRSTWKPLAEPLQEAGFGVFAIDLRGHGESATTRSAERVAEQDPQIFLDMQEDLRAAYDWISTRTELDRARFALVGAGSGCSLALQYAAMDRSVDVIVCMTPGLEYLGLRSEQDIKQIQGRKILLMATEDEREACDRLSRLTDGVTKRIAPGSAHGTRMFEHVSGAAAEIVTFLKSNVGPRSTRPVFGSVNKNVYHVAGSPWIAEIGRTNLRVYSNAGEAEQRGLREARTKKRPDQRGAEARPR
jgi:dienelactone hydrolase